jgi:pimeloyl-ACP methyl ester carboxylesterase
MNGFLRRTTIAIVLAIALVGVASAQPPASESGFVQVEDDVRLYFQRYGSGTPTMLVANRHEMLPVLMPLLYTHDVVLYDPRGRGLSDRPDDLARYGIDREIADADALRQHFGAERIGYVGNSLWGHVALLYAARHPDRVDRVVALGPLEVATELYAPPDRVIERDTSHLADLIAEKAAMEADGRAASDPFAYCRVEKYLGTLEGYVHEASMDFFSASNLCQYRNEHVDRILPVVFDGILAPAGEWDYRDEIRAVTVPVLLLYGDHDHALEGIRAHADYLQDVGWLMVPDAGHGVAADRPDVVVPMMDTFFRGEWPDGLNR